MMNSLESDEVILSEIGKRIVEHRLEQQLTQAALAKEAGISKRTVERIEAGYTAQFSTMIRVLRVLGLFDGLDRLIPEIGPRPMDLLKLKGKKRQRASSSKRLELMETPWEWGDES